MESTPGTHSASEASPAGPTQAPQSAARAPSVASDARPPDEETPAERRWHIAPEGYLRGGYEYVQPDPDLDFVGHNFGFVLANARVGLRGERIDAGLSFLVSAEGAADLGGPINTPEGHLGVRLRDAWLRWDFAPWIGVTLGQLKVPFMAGWLVSSTGLLFASRAVGLEGVPVGRGYETRGIDIERELGLMLSAKDPLELGGDLRLGYFAMLFNGNGDNELIDDNGRPAVAGRLELHWGHWVRLGAAVLFNSRTEGPLPDRFDEEDLGVTGDLRVRVEDLEVMAEITQVTTSFPTVATADRSRLEFHAQAGYGLPFVPFPVVLAYRFAYYDPWQSGGTDGAVDLSSFELMYHTVGFRLDHPDASLGLTAWLDYTFTVESPARSVRNDRLQVMAQLVF